MGRDETVQGAGQLVKERVDGIVVGGWGRAVAELRHRCRAAMSRYIGDRVPVPVATTCCPSPSTLAVTSTRRPISSSTW